MNGHGMSGHGTGERTGRPWRVILVEDETLFRDLLRRALEQTGQVQVKGSYGSAQEALDAPEVMEADAALLDIDLGGEDGITLGRTLRERHPALGIVLLSNHAHLAFVRELIAANLSGWAYLLKKSVRDVPTILRAVEGAHAGEVVLDPGLMRGQPDGGRFAGLSARQIELWSLITQGYSNAAIARHLGLSAKWIENAVGGLYAALGVDARDPQVNARVWATLLYAREVGEAHLTIRKGEA